MKGKRVELRDDFVILEAGEYGRTFGGIWFMRPPAPGFGAGSLRRHDVTEHEDGTITVYPSILVYGGDGKIWHGYLERGVWREV